MTYRDLVADGRVQRRAYAARPEGYRLGEPVPGWERWTPVEETERGGRSVVVVTALDDLTERERALVETWARLDEVAAERGIEQAGPAWGVVHRMQRWQLRIDPDARVTADDYDRATAGLSTDEARLVRAYAVALDDPAEALRMASPGYDDGSAIRRMIADSIARTADQWYGGEA